MRNMTIMRGMLCVPVLFVLPGPIDSVVCTSGPDEPVNGDTPCGTGDEKYDDNEGNVVLTWTGSDEPVDSVVRTIWGSMSHSTVLFVLPGRMSQSVV